MRTLQRMRVEDEGSSNEDSMPIRPKSRSSSSARTSSEFIRRDSIMSNSESDSPSESESESDSQQDHEFYRRLSQSRTRSKSTSSRQSASKVFDSSSDSDSNDSSGPYRSPYEHPDPTPSRNTKPDKENAKISSNASAKSRSVDPDKRKPQDQGRKEFESFLAEIRSKLPNVAIFFDDDNEPIQHYDKMKPIRNPYVLDLISTSQAAASASDGPEDPDQVPEDALPDRSLRDMLRENESLGSMRKDNAFQSGIETKDEAEMIQQRISMQQRHFGEYMRRENARKIRKVKSIHKYLTDKEILTATSKCHNDEDEATIRLTDALFLQEVRKEIAIEMGGLEDPLTNDATPENKDIVRKRKEHHPNSPRKHRTHQRTCTKVLRLNDAVNQGSTEGWSEARINAYKLVETNPNAYYYRFNAPGEQQQNGPWSPAEKKKFLDRVKEMGSSQQWGIFSMVIPGRVGYQCSNYYRHLLKQGEIKDPNYEFGPDGKVHYVFRGGSKVSRPRKREEGGAEERGVEINPRKKAAPKKKGKKRVSDDDDEEDDQSDYEYRPSTKRRKTEEPIDNQNIDNPLADFIDQITCEEVVKPCISPYGHVLGKSTWVRCLTEGKKNICPFTKKPLTLRELTAITWDNFEEIKPKIINW